jgi:AcrR family transcriptional regulator
MGHREDLLEGAKRCLLEKGYARTTARDIVAASGTNLASIGYHYGSTRALMNAAVLQAMEEFGAEVGRVMNEGTEGGEGTVLDRFERFWTHVIASFQADPQVWTATFDVFTVAQRDPDVRAAVADGLEDGRMLWARQLYGPDDDPALLRAVGSLHQALLSGVLVQWLIDPRRAPSAADLAAALRAISRRAGDDNSKLGV